MNYQLFNIGEQVNVKNKDRTGEVLSFRYIKKRELTGKTVETKQYFIAFVAHLNDWYYEEELESVSIKVQEFSDKFELDLLNFMIDVSLDNHDYDHVKYLNEQRQQYLNKKAW